jgi:hypothetical protein
LAALEGQQVVTKKAETGEIALPKVMEEALHKTISALPDQLVADTKLTSATKTTQDMVSKLEVLQEQIQAIKTEEKEKKEKEREEKAKAPATEAEAKQATKKDAAGAYSAEQMKVVSEAVSLLFASAPSKIKREREALEQLKERKEERKEEREEELSAASASTDQPQHQPQPPPQDKVVHTLETKLEKMIAKLDKEMDKIDQRAHTLMSIIDTNQDGTVSSARFLALPAGRADSCHVVYVNHVKTLARSNIVRRVPRSCVAPEGQVQSRGHHDDVAEARHQQRWPGVARATRAALFCRCR